MKGVIEKTLYAAIFFAGFRKGDRTLFVGQCERWHFFPTADCLLATFRRSRAGIVVAWVQFFFFFFFLAVHVCVFMQTHCESQRAYERAVRLLNFYAVVDFSFFPFFRFRHSITCNNFFFSLSLSFRRNWDCSFNGERKKEKKKKVVYNFLTNLVSHK